MKCHCAEIEELHAEVESYQGALARVESLLYEWRNGPPVLMSGLTAAGKLTQAIYPARSEWTPEQIEKLREVLSDGPASAALADAPTEQRSERHHHSRKAMECVHNGSDCCVECCEPGGVTEQRAEGGADVCSRPGRVDGPWHSWKFDGDDPHIICHFCDEMRDSLTGRVIRPAADAPTEQRAEVCARDVGDPPEVCRCLLPRGHSGLHSCKHTERLAEGDGRG